MVHVRATFTLALSSAGCNRSGPSAEGTCSPLPDNLYREQYSSKDPWPWNNDGQSELAKICQPRTYDSIHIGENLVNKVEEEVTCYGYSEVKFCKPQYWGEWEGKGYPEIQKLRSYCTGTTFTYTIYMFVPTSTPNKEPKRYKERLLMSVGKMSQGNE